MELVDLMLDEADRLQVAHMSDLESTLVAAMDEAVLSLRTTSVPALLPLALRVAITRELSAIWLATAQGFADLMADHFEAAFKHLDGKAAKTGVVGQIVGQYVEGFGSAKAAQIIRTTEVQMRAMILGGLRRGEAQEAVFSSIVNKIPAFARVRADIITRTEVHSVGQFASQKMAERASVRLRKVWHTVGDARVRTFGLFGRMDQFNHRVMNGATVSLDQSFNIPTRAGGFESLLFPGHPAGSAGNVINCRCVQTYEKEG